MPHTAAALTARKYFGGPAAAPEHDSVMRVLEELTPGCRWGGMACWVIGSATEPAVVPGVKLEERSCEFYKVVKDEYDRLLPALKTTNVPRRHSREATSAHATKSA
jgi:hypothetical protein